MQKKRGELKTPVLKAFLVGCHQYSTGRCSGMNNGSMDVRQQSVVLLGVSGYVVASAGARGRTNHDKNGTYIGKAPAAIADLKAAISYMQRMKTPPAFNGLDLSTGENQLFGTATIDKLYFTKFATDNSTVNSKQIEEQPIKMMNPIYYIGQPGTTTSKYWRIRHSTKDKDTDPGIPVILGTYPENKGYNVSLELPWDRPHSGDYDLDELFVWMVFVSERILFLGYPHLFFVAS